MTKTDLEILLQKEREYLTAQERVNHIQDICIMKPTLKNMYFLSRAKEHLENVIHEQSV